MAELEPVTDWIVTTLLHLRLAGLLAVAGILIYEAWKDMHPKRSASLYLYALLIVAVYGGVAWVRGCSTAANLIWSVLGIGAVLALIRPSQASGVRLLRFRWNAPLLLGAGLGWGLLEMCL